MISPYTQTAKVDHTHYDTASMVATVESLLNLPPMTIVRPARDADVERLLVDAELPALRRADAEGDPVRGQGGADQRGHRAAGEGVRAKWDFSVEDATPEIGLNQAIWKSVSGRRVDDAGAAARLHHRLAARRPERLACRR